jgi:hypothetical protein
MIRIQILNGPEEGRVAELVSGTHLVGRHTSAALVLQGSAVSGRHLELEVGDDGRVRFRDLGSTNGTWSGGLKVEEGEWFAGSELRAGDVRLRLLAEDDVVLEDGGDDGGDADRELHRRALQEAMGGKRRGGPLVFVVLLVAIGAVAAWAFLGQGGGAAPEGGQAVSAAGADGAVAPAGPVDLLDGAGSFDEEAAEAWQLGAGLAVRGGALVAEGDGTQRAVLVRRFDRMDCALQLEAEVRGGSAWPVLEFGREEAEAAEGSWAGAALGSGPVVISLPCDRADWYRLSLRLEPGASVRGLVAEETDGAAASSQPAVGWSMEHDGANLVLQRQGVELLRALGTAGSWSPTEEGLSFRGAGGWMKLRPGPETGLVALSDGAPLAASGAGEVLEARGLLLRGKTAMWATFDEPVTVSAAGGSLHFDAPPGFTLTWRLDEPLGEAARLDRELRRAEQERDTAELLRVVRLLTSRWPIDEDQVLRAERARDAAVGGGRAELAELERTVAEALFLAAEDEMVRTAGRAAELAARFPGTEIEREAAAMAELLTAEASQVGADRRVAAEEYRERLMNALRRTYPVLAAWMEGRA